MTYNDACKEESRALKTHVDSAATRPTPECDKKSCARAKEVNLRLRRDDFLRFGRDYDSGLQSLGLVALRDHSIRFGRVYHSDYLSPALVSLPKQLMSTPLQKASDAGVDDVNFVRVIRNKNATGDPVPHIICHIAHGLYDGSFFKMPSQKMGHVTPSSELLPTSEPDFQQIDMLYMKGLEQVEEIPKMESIAILATKKLAEVCEAKVVATPASSVYVVIRWHLSLKSGEVCTRHALMMSAAPIIRRVLHLLARQLLGRDPTVREGEREEDRRVRRLLTVEANFLDDGAKKEEDIRHYALHLQLHSPFKLSVAERAALCDDKLRVLTVGHGDAIPILRVNRGVLRKAFVEDATKRTSPSTGLKVEEVVEEPSEPPKPSPPSQ